MSIGKMRLGTRGSALALWQTNHVAALLQQAYPSLQTETIVISTKGDQILDTPLPLVGGKGVFTAELEAALRSGEIDLAVHSLKDLPTEDPQSLTIGAIPPRENPADVLVSRAGYTLGTLPNGATVGTSSNRRAAQLRQIRPDLKMHDIRGNINTRIHKALDPDGPYDAIVLAQAGIKRLEMDEVISEVLSFEQMLPAPGQGALGVQCRDELDSIQKLAPIHDQTTAWGVIAERAFLAGLGGGCSVPVAAYARLVDDNIYLLQARVGAIDGSTQIAVETHFAANDDEAAKKAGIQLALEAIEQGANQLLESV